jgi:hypothetical protein
MNQSSTSNMSQRVIHFEIHATQPERAIAFYTGVLGWKFEKWDGPMPYWMICTGDDGEPGINGGLLPRQGAAPTAGQGMNAYVCTVGTANLKALLGQVTEKGGTIVLPTMAIPGIGWLAYAADTEGNIFGMMQNDPTAR